MTSPGHPFESRLGCPMIPCCHTISMLRSEELIDPNVRPRCARRCARIASKQSKLLLEEHGLLNESYRQTSSSGLVSGPTLRPSYLAPNGPEADPFSSFTEAGRIPRCSRHEWFKHTISTQCGAQPPLQIFIFSWVFGVRRSRTTIFATRQEEPPF